MLDTLRKLVEAWGPSGSEGPVREIILREIAGLADEVQVDPLGNVIAWRRSCRPGAPKVMLDAHMDEIGVMVSHVDDKGFLRFTNIGGVYPLNAVGNRVRFEDGTIGVIAVEKRDNATAIPTLAQLYIDVSTNGKGTHGIRVGDSACFDRTLVVNGDHLVAKSMDDRAGCALLIEVMRQFKASPNDVAFVFSVQEEVGLRGAQVAAYGIEPQIGIAIDVTSACDTPTGPKLEIALGKGPAIKVMDARFLSSPEVIALMERAAKAAKVPCQKEIL
ncbi:MAG: M28 family peptidase, partial [Anaerolineae bacterium]|nr:M28 family peptidase [Anaerolineae bacterium]